MTFILEWFLEKTKNVKGIYCSEPMTGMRSFINKRMIFADGTSLPPLLQECNGLTFFGDQIILSEKIPLVWNRLNPIQKELLEKGEIQALRVWKPSTEITFYELEGSLRPKTKRSVSNYFVSNLYARHYNPVRKQWNSGFQAFLEDLPSFSLQPVFVYEDGLKVSCIRSLETLEYVDHVGICQDYGLPFRECFAPLSIPEIPHFLSHGDIPGVEAILKHPGYGTLVVRFTTDIWPTYEKWLKSVYSSPVLQVTCAIENAIPPLPAEFSNMSNELSVRVELIQLHILELEEAINGLVETVENKEDFLQLAEIYGRHPYGSLILSCAQEKVNGSFDPSFVQNQVSNYFKSILRSKKKCRDLIDAVIFEYGTENFS